MKLIVGLGNPGIRYTNTRHNLGSRVVKALAKEYKAKFVANRSLKSQIARIDSKDGGCILALPTTFMNLSGEAVGALVNYYKLDLGELLVAHDDLDLELGVMRFKKQGSSGGHNGISSIMEVLNSQDFNRLKLGIGRAQDRDDTVDYVLSGFSKNESKILDYLVEDATRALEVWLSSGIDKVMNEFNQTKK